MAHAAKPSSQVFHGHGAVRPGYFRVWVDSLHSQGGLLRNAGSVHQGKLSRAVLVEGRKKRVFLSLDGRICSFRSSCERIWILLFYWICKSVGGRLVTSVSWGFGVSLALFSKVSSNAISQVSGMPGIQGTSALHRQGPKDNDFLGNSYFEVFTKFQLNI